MPSQSASGNLLSPRESVLLAFEPHEWELLTRLPARIMIAATLARSDSVRPTVDEGLAGLNAIAAGAASDSGLVRAIVASIYAEADPDPHTAEQSRDRSTGIAEVLVSCRAAALVLTARATPADALTYREWVLAIAAHSLAEQKLLQDLTDALRNV
jgi:hypothetical protein